ncbi:unnamed protein product [Phytomonas sp. EM1]|nr:unnamed protein product [Phytomonas sp. EM1]|eukprot:CCW62583.1 unnamed protein product [Phytomonas sp. isolate EM1]
MPTSKILSQVCSIVYTPSRSELNHWLGNVYATRGGAITLKRWNAASARFFSTSIANNNWFRNRRHSISSNVDVEYPRVMGQVRSFSTVLISTNVLRASKPLSRFGAKPTSSPKRDRGGKQRPGAKTRYTSKTVIPTSEPFSDQGSDLSYDNDNRVSTATSTSDSVPHSTTTSSGLTSASEGTGWDYETVDPVTGKSPIDLLYESHLERIQQILERPLPPMPPDGHINPDFFVGFAYYNYRLRDEYRAVIAHELQVPLQAVKLSVAWSGRFDVSRFNQVQKVCGVYLDRGALPGAPTHSLEKQEPQEETDSQLPTAIQDRIAALIRAINARRTQHLLQVQLFQASGAIPEVEFALSRREHRLLSHLHSWIHGNILSRGLAVIVRGGGFENYRNYEQRLSRQVDFSRTDDSGSSDDCSKDNGASLPNRNVSPAQAYKEWVAKEIEVEAQQQRFIDAKWLSQFHSREIVPRQLSIRGLAALVTQAVLRGDVGPVKMPHHREMSPSKESTIDTGAAQRDDQAASSNEENEDGLSGPGVARARTEQDRNKTLLSDDQVSLLRYCQDYLQREVQSNRKVSDSLSGERDVSETSQMPILEARLFSNDDFMRTLEQNMQSIALQWICTIQRALFLNKEGTSVAGGFTSSGVSAIRLPSLFVHRGYAGGLVEMRYLKSNKAAMDALLLHPNDIAMKKAFARRLRSGHQRLRIYEELGSSRPGG